MQFSQSNTFFFLVDQLLKKKLSIVLLTQKLNFELLIFLHQNSIIIINFLSNLCHGLKMLIKLLFFLLIIVLIIFLLFLFFPELLFDLWNLFIEGLENLLSSLHQHVGYLTLSIINFCEDFTVELLNFFDTFTTVSNEVLILSIDILNFLNFFRFFFIMDIYTI